LIKLHCLKWSATKKVPSHAVNLTILVGNQHSEEIIILRSATTFGAFISSLVYPFRAMVTVFSRDVIIEPL